ncbi:MAG: RsmE family RNA methyltransferase [Dictyoglomus sp.]
MSPTFFASSLLEPDLLVIDDKSDLFHLVSVLRIKKGEILYVNYRSKIYKTYILQIQNQKIVCKILEEVSDKESKVQVYLCQSLPKRESWEIILEKCTELGISGFVPLQTQRSIVNLSKDDLLKKYDRWNKIIKEAVKQCGRNKLPVLYRIYGLEEALKLAQEEEAEILIAWEGADSDLKSIMKENIKDKIFLFVGPEGSFTKDEIEIMKKMKSYFFNMGPRILRVETAAIVASALLLYEKGGLGLI